MDFLDATIETLILVFVPGIIGILLGTILGVLLYITNPKSCYPFFSCNLSFQILNIITNVGRSVPFVILMIALIPFTRLIMGTSIGTFAACVPLTIAVIPFFGRIVEGALLEVPSGITDSALSLGATPIQILKDFVLKEAQNPIFYGIILTLVTLVGYSAMAGALAGGGLGAMAFNYGYQRFQTSTMIITVCLMIFLVQLIEYLGKLLINMAYKK